MKKKTSIRVRAEVKSFGVRPGFAVSAKIANRVGPVMVRLINEGTYSPKALVDAARDPRSPAHEAFEWDDEKAAEKWRVEQAKLYQRAIVYDVLVKDAASGKKVPVEMRVVHPIGYSSRTRYASGVEVLRSPSLAHHVLERALASIESWREQYSALRASMKLAGIFDAIDEVLGPMPKPNPRRRRRRRRP